MISTWPKTVMMSLLLIFCMEIVLNPKIMVVAETFTVGYLTGSQRKPGDMAYDRPGKIKNTQKQCLDCVIYKTYRNFLFQGLTISGAISLAFSEVNEQKLKPLGHKLEFVVAETFGEEITSIRQTADLWIKNISAYIGPQETCLHEGRMAAAFNLPMISYVRCSCAGCSQPKLPFFILFFSFVHIKKLRIKNIFLHLRALVHQTYKLQNQLCHYSQALIGHR